MNQLDILKATMMWPNPLLGDRVAVDSQATRIRELFAAPAPSFTLTPLPIGQRIGWFGSR